MFKKIIATSSNDKIATLLIRGGGAASVDAKLAKA
jgi:hypothetical protein